MTTSFRASFARDLKKVKDHDILERVREAIEQVEGADDPRGIAGLKKLSGAEGYYRIRLGEYRLGLTIKDDVVDFIRCLPRRDLYRFFP